MPTSTDLSARSSAQIVLSQASVTLGTTRVLTQVDLTANSASRIAIVGENGSGKSTLLRLLAGRLRPDEGAAARTGSIGFAEQEMSTADERTVGEVIAEALAAPIAALRELDAASHALANDDQDSDLRYATALERAESLEAWDAERRIQVALRAFRVQPEWSRRLSLLSVGQRYRVRIACLLAGGADFLMLDEPTNHLDRAGLEYLAGQLKSWSGGVIVVSHDREILADVAQTIVDLDPTPDERPRVYGGGYDGYVDGRRAMRERWEQEYALQLVERIRLEGNLRTAQSRLVSGWRPPKGTGKHQRASRAPGLVHSVHRRLSALEDQALTMPEPPQQLRFPELATPSGRILVTAENVTVAARLESPTSVSVRGGSRLVVTGPNGTGKSTLLAVLAGELAATGGLVRRGRAVRTVLLRQESEFPAQRRADEVYAAHVAHLVSSGVIATGQVIGLSSTGLLRPREAFKRIAEMSVGQQRRLGLAMALASKPQLLLLDEPTNHLSIGLVDELLEALRDTQAAVVVSSHDRQLLRDLGHWPRITLAAEVTSEVGVSDS